MSHRCTSVVIWVVACLLGAGPSIHGQEIFVPRQLKAVAVAQSVHTLSDQIAPDWNDLMARGLFSYHRLARGDFPVNDKMYPAQYAMTTCAFLEPRCAYDCTQQSDYFIARITEWKVVSGFDRNRSARQSYFTASEIERAMPHEQGHLDIGELHSRRLANIALGKLPIGEGETSKEAIVDLQSKVKALAEKTLKEEGVEQSAYEAKTDHGRNDSEQKKATAAIRKRLKLAGITIQVSGAVISSHRRGLLGHKVNPNQGMFSQKLNHNAVTPSSKEWVRVTLTIDVNRVARNKTSSRTGFQAT